MLQQEMMEMGIGTAYESLLEVEHMKWWLC
jgi:hypothetical protein